jgi:hypothetical protein
VKETFSLDETGRFTYENLTKASTVQ